MRIVEGNTYTLFVDGNEAEHVVVRRLETAHVLVEYPDRDPVYGTPATGWVSRGIFDGIAFAGRGWE